MAGIGDSWGTREELLHPRDKNGRFRSKWKMAEGVVSKILAALAAFNPRTFQSDGQAAQYLHNKAKPGRFGGGQGYARLSADFHATQDALRAGTMDTSTKKFVDMMDSSAIELPDDIIASRRVGPEAFGLTPETMHLEEGGIEDVTGKLMADRGYSSMNIGNPMGTGPILVTIAVPKGTKVIIPARSQNDRQLYGDRDQEIRITKVDPDGRGGYYVLAVATPRTPGETPVPIGGPGKASDVAPREGEVLRGQELQAKSQKIVPDEPLPQQAPQAGDGGPSPQGPVDTGPGGPPPRNEPVVTEALGTGGAPQPAAAPVGAPAAPGGTPETPIREADFKEAAKAVPIPSAGKRRAQWNHAYLGIRSGKRDPDDILRELKKDIEVNKADLADRKSRGNTDDPQLADDIQAQEQLADLIGRHHNIDGKTSEEAPATPEPVKAVKKAAPSVPVKKVAPTKAAPAKAAPAERRMTLAEAKRRTALDAVRENPIDDPSADTTYKRISKGLEDGTMTVPQARKQALDSARYFHESATTVGRNGLTTPEKRGAAHASETAKATKYEQLADALQVSQSSLKTDKYRRAGGGAPAAPVKKAVPEAPPAKKAPAPKKSVEGAAPGTAAGKITAVRLTPGTTVLINKDSSGAWRPTPRKTGATKLKVTGNDGLAGRGGRRQISGTGPDGEEIKINAAPSQTFIVDTKGDKQSPADIAAALEKVTTRAEAEELLKGKTLAELKEIAAEAKMPMRSKNPTKAALTNDLIDITAGGRIQVKEHRDFVEGAGPTRGARTTELSPEEKLAKQRGAPLGTVFKPEDANLTERELYERSRARRGGSTPKTARELEAEANDLVGRANDPTVAREVTRLRAESRIAGDLERGRTPDIDKMTVPELKQVAATEGVTDYKKLRKADLQAKIRAHREEVANRTPEDQAIIDSLGDGPSPAPGRPEDEQSVIRALRRVEAAQGKKAGDWVGIADLRDAMEADGISRADQDTTLRKMARGDHPGVRSQEIRLIPVANRKVLTDRDRAAALRTGEDQIDAIKINPSYDNPTPVVPNPVAQKPIQAPDRAADFRLAWTQGGDGFKATGSAGRQLDEIRDDIGTGKITPDEGIRRLETEIGLNKDELAEMDADLRGDMGEEQRHLLKQQRDALAKGISTQEKASSFLRTHFKKEPLATPDEVSIELDDDARKALDEATPEGIREAARAQGITVKGETKEDILKDLVRQMAGKELERRSSEKKAPAPKAPDKPKPDLGTSLYQRLDTRAIAEGLDLRTEWDQKMLDKVQAQLDGTDITLGKNPTPAQIGRNLEKWANGPAGPSYRAATMQATRADERGAEWHAERERHRAQAAEWLKLADRLKNTRRRKKEDRAPDVTPKVTTDEKKVIADVAEVTGIPAEQLEAKALAKKRAEAPPKQSAVQVAETLKTVGSREEAKTLLQGRTKAELVEIAKASGVISRSSDTKPKLIDSIVQTQVGARLEGDALRSLGSSRHTRDTLENLSLADLVAIEDDMGIQRASLNRDDRITAILDKQRDIGADQLDAVMETPPAIPIEPASTPTAGHVAALDQMKTHEEVDEYLAKIKGAELDDLARHFDVDKKSALGKRAEISTAVGFRITRPGAMGSSMGKAAAGPSASNKLDDLADSISRVPGRTPQDREKAIHALLQDLGKTDLNKLAGKFPGGAGQDFTGRVRTHKLTVPERLSVEDRRTWLAGTIAHGRTSGGDDALKRQRVPATTSQAKPSGAPVRRSHDVPKDNRGLTQVRERPGNDEDIYIPNGGRDQGAMHFDSEMGQLWTDLYMDDREPNSFVNEIARMGDRMGYTRGDADLERDVIPLLEKLKGRASDSAVADRIQRTIDAISAPPVQVPDLPEGTPAPIRAALEKLAKIPTARRKGRVGLNNLKESVLDKKVRLLREFVQGGVRGRDFEREFEDRDLHEAADGAFRMWSAVESVFNPRILIGYDDKGKPIEKPNPDYPELRKWLSETQSQTRR